MAAALNPSLVSRAAPCADAASAGKGRKAGAGEASGSGSGGSGGQQQQQRPPSGDLLTKAVLLYPEAVVRLQVRLLLCWGSRLR